MSRPAAAPGLLVAVRAAVPERVRRRLDAGNPAEGWAWVPDEAGVGVTTDQGEVVRVAARDGGVTAADLRCSCLLSPKCLHVLAVAAALAGRAETTAPPAAPTVGPPPPVPPPPALAAIDAGQRAAATAALRAARALIGRGALGADEVSTDDLRRAVHACRATALPRLARAGQRVLGGLADLREGRPHASLGALTAALREFAFTAEVLSRGLGREADVGVGRRAHVPAGSLRLHGVACEPVVSATGFGGANTLVVDATGQLSVVSDVRPGGGAARARAAYEASAPLGGGALTHRDLARHGLFVQSATRSEDGHLGAGASVRAVRSGPSSWGEGPIATRFDEPAASQLARPGPLGWLFLTVTVHGADGAALAATVDGLQPPVRLVPPGDHRELAFVDNLRLLARAPGLRLRLVARPAGRRRTLAALAVGPAPGETRLRLPDDWAGRASLGYDRLKGAHVDGLAAREVEVELPALDPVDPLGPLRRRVERVVLGGRATLPGAAGGLLAREQAALRRDRFAAGAELIGALFRAARAPEADTFALAWTRAATWLEAAQEHLAVSEWST